MKTKRRNQPFWSREALKSRHWRRGDIYLLELHHLHCKALALIAAQVGPGHHDIIKKQLDKNGAPVELGLDQRTGILYDNKDLMLNCVNYLLDDTGLINIRSKDLDLPLLDKEKVYDNYTQTQILTLGLPIFIVGLFGFVFTYIRKKTYSH